MTYGADRIYAEVSYVAYHFHWQPDAILDMEHRQRLRYVQEIAAINNRLNEER
ncbi:DUF6760 family protein [Nocardioides sp. SYSU DS0651]|uniref:DUF6760 family protein n=1 Tax=Nocardioides sp. SYSU DS0651 TaxID=3415955 RepID=UPI003F4C8960